MAINVNFENKSTYLLVVPKGIGDSFETVNMYAQSVITEANKNSAKRILCDERELVYNISSIDIYKLAEFASNYAGTVEKIVLVSDPKNLIDGKFYETVSQNRGLTVKVIDDIDTAKKWLIS